MEEEPLSMTTPPATRYADIAALGSIDGQGKGFSIPTQSVTGRRGAAYLVVINLHHVIIRQR